MNRKIVISLIIFTAVAILIVGLFYYFVNQKKDLPNDAIQSDNTNIEIVCEDKITLFIDDENYFLNYTVLNPNDVIYSEDVKVKGDCIVLEDKYIKPISIGLSYIIINIQTQFNIYTKTIEVNVLPTINKIEFRILDLENNEISKCFVGESYLLEINVDEKVNDSFTVEVSNNVMNLELVEKYDNNLKFSFRINNYGETTFVFKYRNIEKSFKINSFAYIKDFNVDFSNSFSENIIRLYLFNDLYKNDAYNDNIYDFTKFNINLPESNINDYSLEVSNDCVIIEENSIIANKEGECSFYIKANDGSMYVETYKIVVDTIKINSLTITSSKEEITVGESCFIDVDYAPIYAVCNLSCYCDCGISIIEGLFSSTDAGEYKIYAKDDVTNKVAVTTIIVKEREDDVNYHFELKFNNSFLNEYNATFVNDCLTVNANDDLILVPFSYSIIGDDVYDGKIECLLEYATDDNIYIEKVINYNFIQLTLSGKGEIDVTLKLKENVKICYTFKIVLL